MKIVIGIVCGVLIQVFYPEFGTELLSLLEDAGNAISSL